jgi:hypothetical protein
LEIETKNGGSCSAHSGELEKITTSGIHEAWSPDAKGWWDRFANNPFIDP